MQERIAYGVLTRKTASTLNSIYRLLISGFHSHPA